MIKNRMKKLLGLDWLNWWPFWRQEKWLDRLIDEDDANPKDVAKQSTLLAKLNNPKSVITWFEQKDHTVDSRGVAEYLRALFNGCCYTSEVCKKIWWNRNFKCCIKFLLCPKELNKEVTPEKNVKNLKDVKGCDDGKQELEEVVEYLKNPSKFTCLGGSCQRESF